MEVAAHSGWQGETGPAGARLFPAPLLDTMTTWGEEQSRHCTKRKTYGAALCSTGVALVLHPPLPGGHTLGGILGLPGRDLPS
jgi:hypothetical protein